MFFEAKRLRRTIADGLGKTVGRGVRFVSTGSLTAKVAVTVGGVTGVGQPHE